MKQTVYELAAKREYDREYHQREDVKERRRRRENSPEVKERIRESVKSYQQEYSQRDYVKEKRRLYQRRYRAKQKEMSGGV